MSGAFQEGLAHVGDDEAVELRVRLGDGVLAHFVIRILH
jgi:hypothetical protein